MRKHLAFLQCYGTEMSSGFHPAQYIGCTGKEVRRWKAATWQFRVAWCWGELMLALFPRKYWTTFILLQVLPICVRSPEGYWTVVLALFLMLGHTPCHSMLTAKRVSRQGRLVWQLCCVGEFSLMAGSPWGASYNSMERSRQRWLVCHPAMWPTWQPRVCRRQQG